MKKKSALILTFFMTVCVLFSFTVLGAQAADARSGKCGEKVSWKLDDKGVMTIYGKGAMWDFRNDSDRFDYHECPWDSLKNKIKKVVIKSGVTYIGADAFDYCKNLKKVVFGKTVTSIGSFSFLGCEKLQNFTLPESLTSLGQQAFDGCKTITKVVIPDNVTFLDAGIFGYCTSLVDVYIGGSKDAGCYIAANSIFSGCTALEEIKVSEDNIGLTAVDGVLFTSDKKTLMQYPAGKKDKKYVMPSEVKEIIRFAVEDNNYVEVFVLNKGLEYLDDVAIRCCDKLKYISIPSSVIAIGPDNFNFCENLLFVENKSDAIWEYEGSYNETWVNSKGKSFTQLKKGIAYKLNTSFKSGENKYKLTGPNTVAFTGVRSSKYKDVVIPETVTVGSQSFKVTAIGKKALYKKDFVESVKIGANVKSIGSYAFYGCSKLSKVIVGKNVTTIKSKAFAGCNSLKVIRINSLKLKTVGDSVFKGIYKKSVIKVPAEKLASYTKLFKGKGQSSTVKIKKY